MRLKEIQLIKKILRNERRWIIRHSDRYGLERVREKTGYMPPPDVSGWCATSAFHLFLTLKKHGFHSRIILVDAYEGSHVFNELNGYILDVTASQFFMKSQ